MYKVFIADDEEYVVKSLIRSIKWEEYGFEVVASSNDGLNALESILEIKPHLVFADIRMPGMSGLELIKEVEKHQKDILFIIISGYAEFAYAQKAMNYGAIGYCLKPFDEEEIYSQLKKVKGILDEINLEDEGEIISLIERSSEEKSPKLDAFLNNKGMEIGKGITIVVSIGSKQINFEGNLKYVKLKIGNQKYLYFLEGGEVYDSNKINPEKLPEEIKGVGVRDGIYSTMNLKIPVDEAIMSAYQFFITGRKGVYTRFDGGNKSIENIVKAFEKALIKMDIDGIGNALDTLNDSTGDANFNIRHAMNIFNAYVKFASQESEDNIYEDCVYSVDELCALFKDIGAMIDYIRDGISSLIGMKTGIIKEEIKNEHLKKIVSYINQKFFKDISIQSLAQEFCINPNYLSQLFRKEIGITFTEYITNLRVEYARELLIKTKLSLGAVASKCGYSDYFYFIRVFKKVTGFTPGQFRHN